MLRIEAQHILSALDDIADQQLLEIALALTTVAKDQRTAGGLVLISAFQIYNDIGSTQIFSYEEPMRVCLAAVVEREQICNRACRQDSFEAISQDIGTGNIG